MSKGAPFDDIMNDPDLLQPSVGMEEQESPHEFEHYDQTPEHRPAGAGGTAGTAGGNRDSIPDEKHPVSNSKPK